MTSSIQHGYKADVYAYLACLAERVVALLATSHNWSIDAFLLCRRMRTRPDAAKEIRQSPFRFL